MLDIRFEKLANSLIHNSLKVRPGEKVLVEVIGNHPDFVNQLVRGLYAVGATPYVKVLDYRIMHDVLMNASEEQLRFMAQLDAELLKHVDCYIKINGQNNPFEFEGVPDEKVHRYYSLCSAPKKKAVERRVSVRIPTEGLAQMANMNTSMFENIFFDNICSMNYEKLRKAAEPLVELMTKTDRVRIIGMCTDLTFSIKGQNVVASCGELTVPDGEVYTSPIRESVNGRITYNTPVIHGGQEYDNIRFIIKNGRIEDAICSYNTERLNQILDIDNGARYIGEFGIGLNPYITRAVKDRAFDEKLTGSLHVSIGYPHFNCDNGNKSDVHLDLVLQQTPKFGGGEIWFDDTLVRKDGLFVLPEFEGLNPENLK